MNPEQKALRDIKTFQREKLLKMYRNLLAERRNQKKASESLKVKLASQVRNINAMQDYRCLILMETQEKRLSYETKSRIYRQFRMELGLSES